MPEYDFRDNLITLARFNSPTEGALAQARLEVEGIESQLGSASTATWLNHVGPDLIGTELLVRQGDLRRAREVLSDVLAKNQADSRASNDDGDMDDDDIEDDEVADYDATDWSGEDWADDDWADDDWADDDDEADQWSEESESPVTPPLSRAFRAAVIGTFLLLVLPGLLNIYSCWLIARHRLWETSDSWRYYATVVLNVLGFAVAAWFWQDFFVALAQTRP